MSNRRFAATSSATVATAAGMAVALLLCVGSHAGTLRGGYIDPRHLTTVNFGNPPYYGVSFSHYSQPWRAYLETMPAAQFTRNIGMSFNYFNSTNQNDLLAQMLAKNGVRRARVEIGWGALNYDDETRLNGSASYAARLLALRKWGIRPLILLNCNDGSPCPNKTFNATVAGSAPAGSRTIVFTSTNGFVTGRTGISWLKPNDGFLADTLVIGITNFGGTDVCYLSRPLPNAFTNGQVVGMATLKYRPFSATNTADGQETIAGWNRYAATVARFVEDLYGTTNAVDKGFDLELYNEFTFGQHFLYLSDYYSPNPGYSSPGYYVFAPATGPYAAERPSLFSGVVIGDGAANQTPWPSAGGEHPRIGTLCKHPYPQTPDFPAGTRTSYNYQVDAYFQYENPTSFLPAYTSANIEYCLRAHQTETILRDAGPVSNYVQGTWHGRHVRNVNGDVSPVPLWVTEIGFNPRLDAGITNDFARAWAVKAKAGLRVFPSLINKGVDGLWWYSTQGNSDDYDYSACYVAFVEYARTNTVYPADDSPWTSPLMKGLGNSFRIMTNGVDPNLTLLTTRPLQVESISDTHDHYQFAGNGTSNHPHLHNRELLALLPFQANANRFAIPYYVMTVNHAVDLAPESYTVVLRGLNGSNATFRVYDPVNDTDVPVTATPLDRSRVSLELTATDYPYYLIVEESVTPAPVALNAFAASNRVALVWPAVESASGYNVYGGAVSNGPHTLIASGLADPWFVQTNQTVGTTSFYVVSATGPRGESADSPVATAVTLGADVPVLLGPVQFTAPVSDPLLHDANLPAAWVVTRACSVTQGQDVTFSVGYTSTQPATIQWLHDGEAIPGATAATLTLTDVGPGDTNHYATVLANAAGSVTSATVRLDLIPAPAITESLPDQAVNAGDTVSFFLHATGPEPMLHQWRFNGAPFGACSADPELRQVAVSPARAGLYDCVLSTPAGTITSAAARLTIHGMGSLQTGGLWRDVYSGISGTAVSNLTASARFPRQPDSWGVTVGAEAPTNRADSYGQRWSGWLKPEATAMYRFLLCSDDQSELRISSDATPANAVVRAAVAGSTGIRQWSSAATSAYLPLVAGRHYFVELRHKEGSGGDHAAFRWQRLGDPAPTNNSPPLDGHYLLYRAGGVYDSDIAPFVTLSAPADGVFHTGGEAIPCSAEVDAAGHGIDAVQFWNGELLIGTDTAAPYTCTWVGAGTGLHTVTARVLYDATNVVASAGARVFVAASAPATPAGLRATAAGTNWITLTWDNAGDATSWQVQRDAAPAGGVSASTFTDTGLGAGQAYDYAVLASNAFGMTTSSVVVAWTVPDRPAAPAIASTGMTRVVLHWTGVAGAGGYSIWRNGEQVGMSDDTNFTDVAVGPGSVCAYALCATNAGGASLTGPTSTVVSLRRGWSGSAIALPGTIEAENYDPGSGGVSYNDSTSWNSGAAYRNDGVDVESCSDSGGGYDVGATFAGEWLTYSVLAGSGTAWRVDARVACPGGGSALHLEVDGSNFTGNIACPTTGGAQTWQTIAVTNLVLPYGPHLLRLVFDTNSSAGMAASVNWLRFTCTDAGQPGTLHVWTNAAGGAWSGAANWTNNSPPSAGGSRNLKLRFAGAGAYVASNDLADVFVLNALELANTSNTTAVLTGAPLRFEASSTNGANPQLIQNGAASFIISNDVTLAASLLIGAATTGAVTLAGTVGGGGDLVKTGSHTVTLSADNTFTGSVVLRGGNVQIGNGGPAGLVSGDVTNSGAGRVAFFRTTPFSLTGSVYAPSGTVVQAGTCAAMRVNAGLQGGGVHVQGGLTNHVSCGSNAIVSAVTLSVGGNQGGAFAGSGALTIEPGALVMAGNLFLGNADRFTGRVVQAGGSVTITNGLRVGLWPNNVSTYLMGGGTLTLTTDPGTNVVNPPTGAEPAGVLCVGVDGIGQFTQTGGDVATPALVLDSRGSSAFAGTTSTYSLEGGTLRIGAGGIRSGSGDSVTTYRVNLGGGELFASGSWTSPLAIHLSGTNGNVRVNTATNAVTLRGPLTGPGGLVKTGPGDLFLHGTNRYAGLTTISNGTLWIHGSIASGAVTVAAGGTLGGTGRLAVAVTNAGTVRPGDAQMGTLIVSNAFAQTANARLVVRVAAATTADLLRVTGVATLNGELIVVWTNGYAPATNDALTVLTAGSIAGSFTSLRLIGAGSAWDCAVAYDSTSVTIRPVAVPLHLTPSPLDFGSVATGKTAQLNVAASNISASAVNAAITATGPGFSLSGPANVTIPPGTAVSLAVDFTPATRQACTGQLVISAGSLTSTVSLAGAGALPPVLAVAATAVDFGSVPTGVTVLAGLTLRNNGDLALTGSVAAAGAAFAVASGASIALAGGTETNIQLAFTPSSAGSFTGSVEVLSNGGATTGTLRGTGASWARLEASPAVLDFGLVRTGGTAQASVRLTNSGDVAVSATAFAAPPFTVLTNWSFTLLPGANIDLPVSFQPSVAGTFAGSIQVDSDAGPTAVSLAGVASNTLSLRWASTGVTNWDLGTNRLWRNCATEATEYFAQGDSVLFDDTVGIVTDITIGVTVRPSAVLVAADTNSFVFRGSGSGGLAGGMALTKTGARTLTISSICSNTGPTLVSGGTILLNIGGAAGTFPMSAITITNGAELALNAGDALGYANTNPIVANGVIKKLNSQSETLFRPLTLAGGVLTNALTAAQEAYNLFGNHIATAAHTTNWITGAGQFALRTAGTFFSNAPGSVLNIAATVRQSSSGAGTPLLKLGQGTLVLSASNTFTAPTLVNNGTLLVHGYLPTGTVTIAAGATIGGTGLVAGSTTVSAGGTLAPGGDQPGTLRFRTHLTLGGTSVFRLAGTGSDALVVSGRLSRGGAVIVTNLGATTSLVAGTAFRLLSVAGATGAFSSVTLPELSGALVWSNGLDHDGVIRVLKRDQTIDFPAIADQVATSLVSLAATADSALPVSFSVVSGPALLNGGSNLTFTGAGVVHVAAGQPGDESWNAAASVTNTFLVMKAAATVTLDGLTQTYDGASRPVAATTTPTGLTVAVTYDGRAWAPTNAGDYAITGTVVEARYAGSATGTLHVQKAAAQIHLLDLAQTYNRTARVVMATTTPPGLAVAVTYDGLAWAPTNAGSYAVTGEVDDLNYDGVTNGTLVVEKVDQALDFPAIADQVATDRVALVATSGSDQPVTFRVCDGPGVLTDGSNLAFTAHGIVSVAAEQPGDANWLAAAATNTFRVYGLFTVAVVSAHGTYTPAGEQVVVEDTFVTSTVSSVETAGTTQFVGTGWTMHGHDPAAGTGTSVVFAVTNSAVLAWNWQTNYWLDLAAAQHGSVVETSHWAAAGSSETATAVPDRYHGFAGWQVNGNMAGLLNPYAFVVTEPLVLHAMFIANVTSNGVPEWWLAQHGWTNDFAAAADADADGDRMATWAEWRAGTDPTNAASYLGVSGVGPAAAGDGLLIRWTCATGRTYRIARSTNIVTDLFGEWIATNLPAMFPAGVYTDRTTGAGLHLYRVGVE